MIRYTRPIPFLTPWELERFCDKINFGETDAECWNWEGSKMKFGHGQFGIRGRLYLTHRIAYAVMNGPIPGGIQVHHTCDNPACCNPNHLWLGTQKDNIKDCQTKGRAAIGERSGYRLHPERYPRGERQWYARFVEQDIRDIRTEHAAGGISQRALARKWDVNHATIGKIIRRETWKHVT